MVVVFIAAFHKSFTLLCKLLQPLRMPAKRPHTEQRNSHVSAKQHDQARFTAARRLRSSQPN
jgi:hypothetical protein